MRRTQIHSGGRGNNHLGTDARKRHGRNRRLLHRRDFDSVFQRPATRLTVPPLWAAASPSSMNNARLGLVVGKKVLRRAVDRNRAKRAIREAFRLTEGLPAVDIVVRVVSPGPVTAAHADRLFRALRRRLARSRVGELHVSPVS